MHLRAVLQCSTRLGEKVNFQIYKTHLNLATVCAFLNIPLNDNSCNCNDSVSVCICFCWFHILSSCFVLQCSGGFPVFCLVSLSYVCLHVIWARAQPESTSHLSVIYGSLAVSVNVHSLFFTLFLRNSRCYLICIVIISPLLCKP